MSDVARRSRIYGLMQTALFCAFAVLVLVDPTMPLFASARGLRLAGGALCLAGVVLMLVAIRTLGKSIQIDPQPKASGVLTTRGVYGRLRHPVYTGILSIIVGLFFRQPTPLVLGGAIVLIAYILIKVRFEERLLLARYPDYAAYRSRAWGVIPFLH